MSVVGSNKNLLPQRFVKNVIKKIVVIALLKKKKKVFDQIVFNCQLVFAEQGIKFSLNSFYGSLGYDKCFK